jgi:hypothetical protein
MEETIAATNIQYCYRQQVKGNFLVHFNVIYIDTHTHMLSLSTVLFLYQKGGATMFSKKKKK